LTKQTHGTTSAGNNHKGKLLSSVGRLVGLRDEQRPSLPWKSEVVNSYLESDMRGSVIVFFSLAYFFDRADECSFAAKKWPPGFEREQPNERFVTMMEGLSANITEHRTACQ
jgi:hypothetical protein